MAVLGKANSQNQFLGNDLLKGKTHVKLPFEYVSGFIVVEVKFGRIIPLNFIFDTGAANTILFDKYYADIFQVEYVDTIGVKGADIYHEIEGYIVRNGNFTLPKIETTVVRDFITLSQNYVKLEESLGIPIGGILGSDFFKRLTVKIDYCRKQITFYNPDQLKINHKWSEQNFDLVNGKPYIRCGLELGNDQVTANLLLDTGASTSVILHSTNSGTIELPDSTILGHLGAGLSGNILGHIGLINGITIGGYKFKDLIVSFQKIDSSAIDHQFLVGKGIVGNLLLEKFDILLDYVHGKLYLKPNKHFKEKLKLDMSGIILHAVGENLNQFIVNYVIPDSPAALADIRKGDVISKIGRHKASKCDLDHLISKLQGPSGKKIKLTINRNDQILKKEFKLRSLIDVQLSQQ